MKKPLRVVQEVPEQQSLLSRCYKERGAFRLTRCISFTLAHGKQQRTCWHRDAKGTHWRCGVRWPGLIPSFIPALSWLAQVILPLPDLGNLSLRESILRKGRCNSLWEPTKLPGPILAITAWILLFILTLVHLHPYPRNFGGFGLTRTKPGSDRCCGIIYLYTVKLCHSDGF